MADEQKFADEIMSDEELDQVTGGTNSEYEKDLEFFIALRGKGTKYSGRSVLGVGAMWQHYGITLCGTFDETTPNMYICGELEFIDRKTAMEMVMEKYGKVIDITPYL